jgi:hypothetical protein
VFGVLIKQFKVWLYELEFGDWENSKTTTTNILSSAKPEE